MNPIEKINKAISVLNSEDIVEKYALNLEFLPEYSEEEYFLQTELGDCCIISVCKNLETNSEILNNIGYFQVRIELNIWEDAQDFVDFFIFDVVNDDEIYSKAIKI